MNCLKKIRVYFLELNKTERITWSGYRPELEIGNIPKTNR